MFNKSSIFEYFLLATIALKYISNDIFIDVIGLICEHLNYLQNKNYSNIFNSFFFNPAHRFEKENKEKTGFE